MPFWVKEMEPKNASHVSLDTSQKVLLMTSTWFL